MIHVNNHPARTIMKLATLSLLICALPVQRAQACFISGAVGFGAGSIITLYANRWLATQTDEAIVENSRGAIKDTLLLHGQFIADRLYQHALFAEEEYLYRIGFRYFSPTQPTVENYVLSINESIENLTNYFNRIEACLKAMAAKNEQGSLYNTMEKIKGQISQIINVLHHIAGNLLAHQYFFNEFQRNYLPLIAMIEKEQEAQQESQKSIRVVNASCKNKHYCCTTDNSCNIAPVQDTQDLESNCGDHCTYL